MDIVITLPLAEAITVFLIAAFGIFRAIWSIVAWVLEDLLEDSVVETPRLHTPPRRV